MNRADVWHPKKYDDSLSFQQHLQHLPNVPINTIYQLFNNKRNWIDNEIYWIPCKADPPGEHPLIYADCSKEEPPPWNHVEHRTNPLDKKDWIYESVWFNVLKTILHHIKSTENLFLDYTFLVDHYMTAGEMEHCDPKDMFKVKGSGKCEEGMEVLEV